MTSSSKSRIPPTSPPGNNGVIDKPIVRISSKDLLQQRREIEIEHMGRIYRLRVTQQNKLILTA